MTEFDFENENLSANSQYINKYNTCIIDIFPASNLSIGIIIFLYCITHEVAVHNIWQNQTQAMLASITISDPKSDSWSFYTVCTSVRSY